MKSVSRHFKSLFIRDIIRDKIWWITSGSVDNAVEDTIWDIKGMDDVKLKINVGLWEMS